MKTIKLLFAACLTILSLAPFSSAAISVVDLFGNTISGDVTFNTTFTDVTDGGGTTNGRVIAWDSTSATLSGSGAPTMYGGARIQNGAAASWSGGTNRNVLLDQSPDRIRLGVDGATFTQAAGFMYVDGADFLDTSSQWALDDGASLSTNVNNFTNSFARWLVRSGGQFYVSNSTIGAGSTSLTGASLLSETWTAYNPVSGITSTFSSDYASYVAGTGGTIATSALDDVDAFGLYFESSGANGANWNNAFDGLTLEVVAVPEPSTYALFLGLTCIGVLSLRRLKRR